MRKHIIAAVFLVSVLMGTAYAGQVIATLNAWPDPTDFAPVLILAVAILGLIIVRPRSSTFAERSSSRRWRHTERARWRAPHLDEIRRSAVRPVTWGSLNWLTTTTEDKKIVNVID